MTSRVDKLIGIPYKTHGRSLDGCDCWGLAYLFHDKKIPSYGETYLDADDTASTSTSISENKRNGWERVEGEERFGDIIIFNIRGIPVHAAVYIGKGMMLHSLKGHNSCVEPVLGVRWATRIEGFYRWQN